MLFDVFSSAHEAFNLAVEQLFPAALGLGWFTKGGREGERGEGRGAETENNEERKGKRVHYLITLFVQDEVNG